MKRLMLLIPAALLVGACNAVDSVSGPDLRADAQVPVIEDACPFPAYESEGICVRPRGPKPTEF